MCLTALINEYITADGVVKAVELGLAFWGCIIASKGLQTWREQVIEEPKIKLAREIVESFYNMKRCFRNIRKPYITCNLQEMQKYFKKENISEFQASYLYRIYLLETQYESKILNFQDLREKAKVYYSKDIQHCFDSILELINHFQHACITYIKDLEATKNQELSPEYLSELSDIIHEIDENDDFNKKIDFIIDEVECNLKPVYEAKTIKWKKLNFDVKDTKNE